MLDHFYYVDQANNYWLKSVDPEINILPLKIDNGPWMQEYINITHV